MKDPKMAAYYSAVRQLEGKFDDVKLHHVKCTDNVAADTLALMDVMEICPRGNNKVVIIIFPYS
jgi:hypothetical protein